MATTLIYGTVYVAIHGARYIVPAGQMLCAYATAGLGSGAVQWAGFQAY